MAIVAQCPHCGKRFKADEKLAGKKAKCSQCAQVFTIGGAAAPAADSLQAVSAHATATTTRAAPPAAPVKVRSPDDLVAPEPPGERPADLSHNVDRPPPRPQPDEPSSDEDTDSGASKPLILTCAALIVIALGVGAVALGPKVLARLRPNPKPGATAAKIAKPVINTKSDATTRAAVHLDPPPIHRAQSAPDVRTVADVLRASPAGVELPTAPVWTATADQPAKPLSLPENFRLPIPAESGLRFSAPATALAPPPGAFAAVAAAPETDRAAAPTVEIWNLAGPSRAARFKLKRPLAFPVLSADGAWYAGQAYDELARQVEVEVWSTATGQLTYTIPLSSPAPLGRPAVIGFQPPDQIVVLGPAKLQVHHVQSKPAVRELAISPPPGEDAVAAASPNLKLLAVADAKTLTLIDLGNVQRVGVLNLPDAVVAHPRRPLAPRAVEFSPDGQSLSVVFDNRSSARRIAVVEVASGRVTEIHAPAAPVYTGGPELQWLSGGSAFLVGSGVLIDRRSDRQIGRVYTDLADEGLGGSLISLVGPSEIGIDRALIAWDKPANGAAPASLVLRAVTVRREAADWVDISIASASTALYDQLQCVSRQFGNAFGFQSMSQVGRLADREQSRFLVVNVEFSAAVAEHAPDLLPFRPDQFALIADGVPRPPIGTLAGDGSFNLEPPEYDLRKYDRSPRRRAIVFAATGKEKTLALRIANKEKPLGVPAAVSEPPTPALTPIAPERLPASAFTAPDDKSQVTARILQARVGPYTTEPDAAEHLPLSVTYTPPRGTGLLAVQFELTATTARGFSRGGGPPKPGLLLPDGTHLRPVIELPGLLPVMLSAGERRTHTCLFLLPATAPRYRLTYENAPVATVKPDAPTADSTP
jgi:hypothetical protein